MNAECHGVSFRCSLGPQVCICRLGEGWAVSSGGLPDLSCVLPDAFLTRSACTQSCGRRYGENGKHFTHILYRFPQKRTRAV